MAVKTKTPTSTTATAPRIPAPASQAARAPGTRPSASAAASRLAVSPQAVSTSQQRRSAAQTPAPVPSAQKQKTPVTLPPGLNAQEKKDAGLIGRVLHTTPKFAELVANRAASGQLSSKQLNDLAYIAKQGQVHGRTDQQVIISLEKAMKGMLPNAVPAGQNQGSPGRPSPNSVGSPSIGKGLGQQLGALLNYDIGDALVQRVNTAGIQWATARGNQELAQFLQNDLAAHNHLKEVGLAGAAGEVARALPGEFQNGRGQYSVGSIAAGVGNLSGLGDAKGLMTGTDFKGRPINKYQGALNIGLGAATGVVGRSSIGGIGQAATRTLSTVSAKGNQVLDTMAYGLFGGGPGPALAYAGGGVGSAVLNTGRQLGNLPKGMGMSGVAAIDFMAKSGGGGRQANRLNPDPKAVGPDGKGVEHTTYKIDSKTGKVYGYVEWLPNEQNPIGFEVKKRVDITGGPHTNKMTLDEVPTPHVQGKDIPGGVRPALPGEIPK